MNNEISESLKRVSHLIDNCLINFSIEQLEIVKARHNILLQQQMFWVAQDNLQRFHYDLKEYGMWLCDYIADVEREKNGNEGWENYS